MKTGIQVSSVKPLLTTPEQTGQTFDKMAVLGCRYVQLQWIDPSVSVADIAAALDRSGMRSLGTQDFYTCIRENLQYYVNLNAATGGQWLTVSRIPEAHKSPAGLDRFASELEALREKLMPLGQRLCLHPVSADFTAVPGMEAVEYLLDRLPWLEVCLDLYHLDKHCADMPAFIRRYAGRIPMVHFKDHRDGKLVPAGQGVVRWEGVVPACLEAGVAYGLAEQEQWEGDPFGCLGKALSWLEGALSTGPADGCL